MFDRAYASGKFAYQVRRDTQNGMKVGVYSTPAFFIISQLPRCLQTQCKKIRKKGAKRAFLALFASFLRRH
jgi:hypothetical protein